MWWIIGIIAFVLIIILFIISTYNRLVILRNRVRDQWAQIDVQLKRRFDLIPNVVNTVKGYAKHESETLENVIKARNTFMSASTKEDEIKADGELTNAISKLFALTESYPELKANENFIKLQDELKETENKTEKTENQYSTEYAQHGITVTDGIYYYHGERVRIFMDLRMNGSFENFIFDNEGSIDLRVLRDKNNSITNRLFYDILERK